MDKIVSGWRYLGWPVPVVTEETRPDYVVLTMPVGISGKRTPQEKPVRKTDKKSLRKEQIWEFCQEPRSASEILELLGLRNKENLMEIYLTPMLKAGILTMTEPETPTSRNQKYKAVEHGQ